MVESLIVLEVGHPLAPVQASQTRRPTRDLPGVRWNVVLTVPFMLPACSPAFAPTKDIAEVIIL